MFMIGLLLDVYFSGREYEKPDKPGRDSELERVRVTVFCNPHGC